MGRVFKHPVMTNPLKVTSPFGALRSFAPDRPHRGLDLRAAEGTEVYAPFDGVVVMADHEERQAEDSGGFECIIQGDNGWRVGFAHLLVVLVNVGDRVEAGELVGGTGETGIGVHGPHLHVSLRTPSGELTDPEPHVRASREGGSVLRALVWPLLFFGARAVLRRRRKERDA